MRLHFSYDVSSHELASVRDTIYNAIGHLPADDQLDDFMRALPLDIVSMGLRFSFGDTEVREKIYSYVKSEYNIMWDKTPVVIKAYDITTKDSIGPTTEIVGVSTIAKCVEFGIPTEVIFEQDFEVFLSREDATALMRL